MAESAAAAGLAAFHIRGQGREVRGLEMRSKLAFRLKSTLLSDPAVPIDLQIVLHGYHFQNARNAGLIARCRCLVQNAAN